LAATSKLVDLNAVAIFMVDNHPGWPFVNPAIQAGLEGAYRLVIPDFIPLRARWILAHSWRIPSNETDRAVESFLEHRNIHYAPLRRETYLRAYSLSRELRHDVYDTLYLAMALEHGVGAILTCDTDFRKLCGRVGLDCENPVPRAVLQEFAAFSPR